MRIITWVNVNGFLPKLGVCIDIMEVWFGNANGQILSIFDRVSAQLDNGSVFLLYIFISEEIEKK